MQILRDQKLPVVMIKALDNPDYQSQLSDKNSGLPSELICTIGARVMLKVNLWVEGGLVNGALGTVRDIIYRENSAPPDQPLYILVEFDNYRGACLTDKSIPIVPLTRSITDGDKIFSRKQFPLTIAYAATIHKSQGLTLSKIAVDIGDKEMQLGITYVALSRVRKLNDILLLNTYPKARFDNIFNNKNHLLKSKFMEKWNK